MEKKYKMFLLCATAIVAFVSCGKRTEDTSKYEDSVYIACENRDFVKAYMYAKKIGDTKPVVKKEAQYVLETQGESGLVRISMIVNEHNASWVYQDILNMAISMGNEELATKIYKMSDVCDEHSVDYAVTANMEGLVSVFISKNPEYIEKQNVKDYLKEKGTYENLKEIAQSKLLEKKIKDFREKLESILSSVHGTKPPKGLQHWRLGDKILDNEYDDSYQDYINYYNSSQKANTQLDDLLTKAMRETNIAFCKEIISSYKETINITLGSDGVKVNGKKVDENHCYIEYTNEAMNNAQKRLDEAIKKGDVKK